MKKLLMILLVLQAISVRLSAQMSNVESAIIYLRNSEIEEARKAIDQAAMHESTMNDPKMWWAKAAVYDTIYRNPEYRKYDNNTEENFVVAGLKCMETDTKKRYEDYCSFAVINGAFAAYNKAIEYYERAKQTKSADDEKNAIKYFQYVIDVMVYDKNKDLVKNNINEKSITLTIAYMAYSSKNFTLAKKSLEKLMAMAYNDPIIFSMMSNVYMMEGDTSRALTYIEQGRQRFPTDKDLTNQELNIYMLQGRQQVLLNRLNDAIAADPENTPLLFVRGSVYDNIANDALKHQKLAKDTSAALARKAKGEKVPAAKAKYESLAKSNARLADSLYITYKSSMTSAEKDYQEVVKQDPEHVDAWYNLGALTNNKSTEIAERMNALNSSNQQDYDRKWNAMKKVQDSVLTVALGYFKKSLELAEMMPDGDEQKKKLRTDTLVSIYYSMQQVYANLGDEKNSMEARKKRKELEEGN